MSESEKKPKRINEIFRRISQDTPDFETDVRDSILSQTPRGGRLILYATLVFFFVFIIWASFSQVEETTRGEGKVIPSSHIQIVQNLEGGIVSEILVQVGDEVKKDQLLLKIDDTRFASSFQENRVKYLADRAKLARLQAEAQGVSFKVPEEVTQEKPEIGELEQQLYRSRMHELESSLSIKNMQANQRNIELQELKSRLEELRRTYALLQQELKLTKPLVAQGAVSDVEILRMEREASQKQGEIESIRHEIPRAQSRHEESMVAIKEARLNFANRSKAELNEVLAKVDESSSSSVALKDRLDRTSVRSPMDGTVNRLMINTVGGVVQPGMNIVEIVPKEDNLVVEAMIKPSDIAFLRPKQQANVKFTAYDYTIYGSMKAILEHISADSITDEKGNSFYLVRLRTDKGHLGTDSSPLPIIPGMVATVDILTGKKSIMSYILKPVLKAKANALRER
ncbi:MAG: HlyD family type I secretion periplasmic adaptor subunit [Syntrophobacterales bacterium]|nr:HlyD family type I secretion periplasmic adaptor subunit [Syntrophobacterales bacterium]